MKGKRLTTERASVKFASVIYSVAFPVSEINAMLKLELDRTKDDSGIAKMNNV